MRDATRGKPASTKVERELAAARKSLRNEASKRDELEKRLAENLEREQATGEILQEKNRALTEARAQQTATSEILRVISSSPTDEQPVFDAIVQSARRLLSGHGASLSRVVGDMLHLAALTATSVTDDEAMRKDYPRPISGHAGSNSRAVRDRAPAFVADILTDPGIGPKTREVARLRGFRSVISVPMLREGVAIGAISVTRPEAGRFTDEEIALLQSFADQAVIAIENVRLFKELEASNRDLTEALDQQTATSDILRVISRSNTDVHPVFQAIVDSARRLLHGNSAVISRIVGDLIELAAYTRTDAQGDALLESFFPIPLHPTAPDARPIREHVIGGRVPYNVADTETDARVGERGRANARARGYRSQLVVPLLRQTEAIGTIAVTRREPGGFTDDEIAFLQTFADQAVIAIENVRLFNETKEALDQQAATAEILRVISTSPTDVQPVFDTIVRSAVRLCTAASAAVFRVNDGMVYEPANYGSSPEALAATRGRYPKPLDMETPPGVAILTRSVFHVADTEDPSAIAHVRQTGRLLGVRSIVSLPMLREGEAIGAIVITRREAGRFSDAEVELLKTFADQAVIAIENVRLFGELEQKSRELETASQHKSEFLANMSHELRTPLNAIIGFSEVLTERMFGELNDKQDEYLKDIHASGQHLLSLINDILDLSKVEAGRMELELTDFDLPSAIDNALILVRERSTRRGVILERSIDERLAMIRADDRKIKQVLLNLLSNAIKFTPEGGRIDVKAALMDGAVEISVTDSGIGIAPEDQQAVFEEFRQVGGADKKAEGTGLGLALCRKFVELHGGRIGVKSQVGAGSTFTFTLPLGGEDR